MSYIPLPDSEKQLRIIRAWLIAFIILLVLSGLTAFALETELRFLVANWPLDTDTGLYKWVQDVFDAIRDTNSHYPYLAYSYDWLAFAHLVIATAFIGPLRDPVRNKWILQFGIIACIGVFPLAFIAGPIRGIPISWRLIDCSFGVFGLIPLVICYKKVQLLERLPAKALIPGRS